MFLAELIAEEYIKSNVTFTREPIDLTELALSLILTITISEEELIRHGIRDHCPRRINTMGRTSTMIGQAFINTEKRKTLWHHPKEPNPDSTTIMKMVAYALDYELTGEIAGVVMSWWDNEREVARRKC